MKHFKLFGTLIIMLTVFVLPKNSFSANEQSIRDQISSTNSQIQALDKEIKKYQEQIAQTAEEKNTLANLIKELTLTRNKLVKEKEQTEKKITATTLIIGSLSTNITTQEKKISTDEESIARMLNQLHRRDDLTIVERLLSQESIALASREYNNMISFNEEIRGHITKVTKEKESLEATRAQKQGEQKNLKNLKKTLIQKQQAVEITTKEKNTLLVETKNKEENYKKILLDRQKKRDAFEKELAQYEEQLKFILNTKLLPSEGSGVLSWPLDNVFVTQLFGRTVAAKRLYTSGSHSGVDFRASIGTPVKSMGSGTVVGTGDTDEYCRGASFGKWVFIKYDNGLSSTFGHLSSISSSAGQRVEAGDVVALSGNTGHSTAPHLHVTVYASQGADVKTVPSLSCNGKTFTMPIASTKAYLDPMLYLPSISSSKIKSDRPRD